MIIRLCAYFKTSRISFLRSIDEDPKFLRKEENYVLNDANCNLSSMITRL